MIQHYLLLFICTILISKSISQIYDINFGGNTQDELKFLVNFNENNPINITEIKTDLTNQSYIPSCVNNSLNSQICKIQLNPISQSEKYTFIDVKNPTTQFKKNVTLDNKFNLKIESQPKTRNETIIKFSGLYFQPYPPGLYYLTIITTNLNINKTFSSSNGKIKFTSPTTFQIDIGESVGDIKISIKEPSYQSPILTTYYQRPIIESIEFESNQITIRGDNFGNSIYLEYIVIKMNSTIQDQSSIIENNNNIIIFNTSQINDNFSNQFQFEISIANISNSNYFIFQNRPTIESINTIPYKGGEITISGKRLNSKRFDNSSSEIEIKIGDYICSSPSNINEDNSSIKCNLPSSSNENDENLEISIKIDSIENNPSPIKFTFNNPSISRYQHEYTNIDSNNDDKLIIFGDNFDNSKGIIDKSSFTFNGITIQLNNTIFTNINNNNNNNKTTLIIPLPQLFNNNSNKSQLKNGDLIIHTPNNKLSNSISIKLKPIIQQTKGSINKNGGIITIIGKYFNLKRFNNDNTQFNIINQHNISICNDYKQPIDSNTILICNHSPTKSVINNIFIIIDNQLSSNNNNNNQIEFQKPIIQSIQLQQESSTTIMNIFGYNFGIEASLIQIQIGNFILQNDEFSINEISFENIQLSTSFEFEESPTNITIIVNNQKSNEFEVDTISRGKSGLSIGIIVGIVLSIVCVSIVLLLSIVYIKKKGKEKIKDQEQLSESQLENLPNRVENVDIKKPGIDQPERTPLDDKRYIDIGRGSSVFAIKKLKSVGGSEMTKNLAPSLDNST
ncbi:IPT/TIG domain-containing protein [Tieghemostelium lacteum]|uniref:IPT/TIG domain-containing protein n=1 Tax=Tieghemostelium lacteum TaxID=361077 RepID=A0A151ZI93_TIELA|nr:IPT/TIG domain-containing protein [Tieghemostelium lacteum]|eukprot:KYQ93635.1 IPT/TIG domain-containing protein [Tieghemostelium lacteum]